MQKKLAVEQGISFLEITKFASLFIKNQAISVKNNIKSL